MAPTETIMGNATAAVAATTNRRVSKAGGRVHCGHCGELVGLVWFGKEAQLVESRLVGATVDGSPRAALLLHACGDQPQHLPSPATDGGRPRRRRAGG
jgi:hypothetical protein